MSEKKKPPRILIVSAEGDPPLLSEVARRLANPPGAYEVSAAYLDIEKTGRLRMLDSIKLTPLDMKVERQRVQTSTFRRIYGKKGRR